MTFFVSTSLHPTQAQEELGKRIAGEEDVIFIPRGKTPLENLFEEAGMDQVILVTRSGLRFQSQQGQTFFFHPNLSLLRIKNLLKQQPDPFVTLFKMKKGQSVLDCTLGMGADAIVSSFLVGDAGKVVALESQPVIAVIVKQGLLQYHSPIKPLEEAMRRIQVCRTNYHSYLRELSDNQFDFVLFDPMFEQTVQASSAMQMLKQLANHQPLNAEAIEEALRVCKDKVMVKGRSKNLNHLGIPIVKKAGKVSWGVLMKRGQNG